MAYRLQASAMVSLLLAVSLASSARAAELVTLRNGFTVNCSSREAITPGTIRLHLKADDTQSYMDVSADSIATVEDAMEEAIDPSSQIHAAGIAPQVKSPEVSAIARRSGEAHNLNVALLIAVIRAESAGDVHAVSRAGARGLMQLMPATATQLGVSDSFSPQANVNGGSAYLDRLLTRYHENVVLALAAYNAGPAAVDRYHGIPPYRETQIYVAKVIRLWNSLVAAQGPLPATDRAASR